MDPNLGSKASYAAYQLKHDKGGVCFEVKNRIPNPVQVKELLFMKKDDTENIKQKIYRMDQCN